MIRSSLVVVACCLLSYTTVVAQEGSPKMQTYRLEEAIQLALQQNYDIRIARQAEQVARTDLSYTNAGFFPTVTLTGNGSRTTNQSLRQGDPEVKPVPERTNVSGESFGAALNVDWTLFDGLRNVAFYERMELVLQNTELSTRIAIEQVIADVVNAYYTVVFQSEQYKLLVTTLEISEERYRFAQARKEVGAGSGLEALQSTVDLNTDRSALLQQRSTYQQAVVDINELLGLAPETEFIPEETAIELDTLLVYAELAEAMQAHNRTLDLQYRQQLVQQKLLDEARANQYPTVSFVGGYSFSSSVSDPFFRFFNTTSLLSQTYGFNVGLRASLTLFDGLNLKRAKQQAVIGMETLRLQAEQLNLQLMADLTRAYLDYQNNLEILALETQNVEVARRNAEVALERYRIGVSTPLELREAQVAFVNAQSRLLSARLQARLAQTELERLSGSITVLN